VSNLASVEIERLDEVEVVRVTGEIDASNANAIQRKILESVGNEGVGLVIDLMQTGYVDSAGIRILFDVGERLQVRGMEMRLAVSPGSFLADVLETVRIAERFAVDSTVASAVAAVAAGSRDRTAE
jgi:anti-sigma B factor antagonist